MRLGVIVNPVAGMGGPLGFHGTDGALGARAAAAGGAPSASARAALALAALRGAPVEILAASGSMGADAARAAGLDAGVVHRPGAPSDAGDTAEAARAMVARGVELIAFAGGDGTARDLMGAVGDAVPVLGIPAGVKLHSSVFATSPRAAGEMLRRAAAQGGRVPVTVAEVLDRPGEDAPPRLFGTLRTPAVGGLQPAKASRPGDAEGEVESACLRIARELRDTPLVILGPGSTMLRLKRAMGFEGTLLGVDLFRGGEPPVLDASEETILAAQAAKGSARLALGIVGGQGFLLGRGNQQISAAVLRGIDRADIVVIASAAKLAALPAGRLLVDTGEDGLDALLAGYMPVQVSARRKVMMRVDAA